MMLGNLIKRAMTTLSEIRDALQLRLLTHLYRGTESSSLVLKGGAAMRVEKFRSVPMSAEFGLISRETTQKGDVRAPTKSRSRR